MSRLIVLRSALGSFGSNWTPVSVTRGGLASLCLQHKRYQNLQASTRGKHDRILESPFPGETRIPDQTLTEYLWQDVDKWLSKPAVTCGISNRSYTYGEVREFCRRFANALIGACGLKKGDVVGIVLPNIPEYMIAIHGIIEAGLIATFANPLYTGEEIIRQFQNAGVKCSVTIPQLLPLLKQVVPSLPDHKSTIVVSHEDVPSDGNILSFKQLLTEAKPANIPKVSPDDVALLPYSSGTTGLPKGVRLSNRNLVVNLEQLKHPKVQNHRPTTETTQEVILSVLPFFHIYGFNGILNATIMHGMHLISIPKFTPEDYLTAITKYKPTVLFVVPSLLLFLATHPAVSKQHLESVEKVVCGAAPATKNLIDKFHQKVDRHNINIRQGYGMTESSPVTLFPPNDAPFSKSGSCGQLLPLTQAKVIDLLTGESLAPHQSGELLIRGPQVMLGYLNNEEATKETLDSEGWLHTGDVAYYDEDEYFYIVDRTKELIKVKGNQVSPTELESLLHQMPGVADVAVVGVPDVLAGEVPRAFIVRQPNATLTEEEVQQFIEPKVASFKKLAGGVRFIEVIPRNPAGKILRHQLKVLGE